MLEEKKSFKWILIYLAVFTSKRQALGIVESCPPYEKKAEKYVACESKAAFFYELSCDPKELLGFDDPDYDISWTFNGDPMPWPYGSSSFKNVSKRTLESEGTSPNDAGNYTCTVTTSNGTTVSRILNLCITKSADFGKRPFSGEISNNIKVMPGNNMSFHCKAFVGNPKCLNPDNYTVFWWRSLKNGTRRVEPSRDVEIKSSIKKNGEVESHLEFKSVREEHYGTYECVVTNAYGNLTLNVTLEKGVNEDEYFALLYKAFLVIVAAICIFMPVAICFCRRFRNVLALYYKEKTFDPSVADGYSYDIFVVHGEAASRWVWEVLQPNLEDIYGYKCFLPERDLVGGEVVIDAISKTIPKCLRVIVVITPCLMKDHWSAWAIHHAYKAAMNTPTRILPLVLQDIKEKHDHPDPHGVLDILKILMATKIRVPFACQLNENEKKQEPIKAEGKPKPNDADIKTVDFKLKLPEEKIGSLRSRSRSPKNQKVMNMISASKDTSRSVLEDDCCKRKISLGGEKENKEKGRRGSSPPGFFVDVEEEEPGSPCSITPFLFRRKSSDQLKKEKCGTWLWRCLTVVFAGDEEQLFWQTLRLRLSPPLSRQLARMNQKSRVWADC